MEKMKNMDMGEQTYTLSADVYNIPVNLSLVVDEPFAARFIQRVQDNLSF